MVRAFFKRLFSVNTKLFCLKCYLFIAYIACQSFGATALLFMVAHHLRNYVGLNWRNALLCASIACLIASSINYYSTKYLKDNDVYKMLYTVMFVLLILNFVSIIAVKVYHAYGISVKYKFSEYCGDWVVWYYYVSLLRVAIFKNPDFDKAYLKAYEERKKKKK